ncbi:MAG: hypothetical protein Q8J88_11290 [Bacteroidales bacterium]|nr:hypothetical protein [Bacteroidales bacterium]
MAKTPKPSTPKATSPKQLASIPTKPRRPGFKPGAELASTVK